MNPKEDVMLTTIDNPFNPFTNFDDWFAFDLEKGYNTCSYLDRMTFDSDAMGYHDQNFHRLSAIDDIVELNVLGIYRKVTPSSKFLASEKIFEASPL